MKKRISLLISILGITFFYLNTVSAINLKQEEGKVTVENKYYKATLSSQGGSINSLILKKTGDDLTEETGIGNDIETTQNCRNEGASYKLTIEKETKKEIFLKARAKGICFYPRQDEAC